MTPTLTERWDEFARADAHRYICTGVSGARAFWASGEQTVERELLPLLEEFRLRPGVALEIGCGVGRLLLPLAKRFTLAVGVDISPEMVRRAGRNAASFGVRNADWIAAAEPGEVLGQRPDLAGKVDLLYSLLVFQHIERDDLIDAYLAAAAALLAEDGLAYLHFDTRRSTVLYRLRNGLPERLLPWFWKRSIRRIRRQPPAIERLLAGRGFTVLRQSAPRSAEHRYLLRRDPRAGRAA